MRRNERKMGGFASWEIFGKGLEILIFLWFSHDIQISKFWIFLRFPAIFRGPKKSQNADFSAVSRDFEGRARPKIPCGFSCNEQGSKSRFSRGVPQFFGDPKNSQNAVFPWFLGISKDGLVQKILELGLPCSFLRILKCWTHPKNY